MRIKKYTYLTLLSLILLFQANTMNAQDNSPDNNHISSENRKSSGEQINSPLTTQAPQSTEALQKRAKEAQLHALKITHMTHYNLDLMIACKMDDECIQVKIKNANIDQALAHEVLANIYTSFKPNISLDEKLACVSMLKKKMTGQEDQMNPKEYANCWKDS